MKIAPTLQGGIRIDIESLLDWARLKLIPIDAAHDDTDLALTLGSKMEMDDDWKEYVLPDIQASFNKQLQFVHKEIKIARSKNAEKGVIHITPKNVSLWYGALNQARIALESRFKVSAYELADPDLIGKLDDKIRAAIIKYHFYTIIQNHLLEHVLK